MSQTNEATQKAAEIAASAVQIADASHVTALAAASLAPDHAVPSQQDQTPHACAASGTVFNDRSAENERSVNLKDIKLQEKPPKTLTGHDGDVYQVIFLPDGRLASCSWDRMVIVWDTASGTKLFTLDGHTHYVFTIAMLPNGWLASGSYDNSIKLFDLEERKVVRTLSGHTGAVFSLKALKNGNLVSCSADDTLRVWIHYGDEKKLPLTIKGHENMSYWRIPVGVLSKDFLVTCSRDIRIRRPRTRQHTESVGSQGRPPRSDSFHWAHSGLGSSRSFK